MQSLVLTFLLSSCVMENRFAMDDFTSKTNNIYEVNFDKDEEDRFYNPAMRPANILIAVDKSCSMLDEQFDLWNNMNQFVSILNDNNIDYRIGTFSTSSNILGDIGVLSSVPGATNNWVTPDDSNPGSLLQSQLDWSNGTNEAGIDAMFGAINYNYDSNNPFWRFHTPLHLIVISDEEDQSIYVNLYQLFNAVLEYELIHQSTVTFSSVIVPPKENLVTSGYKYAALSLALGGEIIDINQDDWADALDNIAYLATDMPYEYYLRSIPEPSTINVSIEDDSITLAFTEGEDWIYSQIHNSIIFTEYKPTKNQVVVINYTRSY